MPWVVFSLLNGKLFLVALSLPHGHRFAIAGIIRKGRVLAWRINNESYKHGHGVECEHHLPGIKLRLVGGSMRLLQLMKHDVSPLLWSQLRRCCLLSRPEWETICA